MPEKLGTAVLELRTDNSRLLAGMASAKQRVANLGKSFTRAGRSMTTGLTLPIVAAGTAATKLAADFEKSMSEIVGLVGVSQGQVDQWSEQIKRLGPELGKSPKELADAMFFITSAGLRGAEAMDTLVASAKASAGGLGDITAVADAATSAMNAYGSENLSASEATDILVATVREGKVAADELAGSIGKVIPMASVMGVEFNEVGAVLAGLTRIGFDSATATTALRATMTGLLKPTSEAEDTLKEMGLSSEGLRKQIKEEGLLAVLFELNNRFQGNEAALAKVFPNVRALSGVLGVLGDNSDEVQEIMGRMADNTGATESAFKVAADTLTFQFNIAMANLKTALIEVGEVVGPVVLPLLNKVASAIKTAAKWFKELNPETKSFLLVMAGAAAAIGPALLIIGKLATAVSVLIGIVSSAAMPWVLLGAAVAAIAVIMIRNWDYVVSAAQRFGAAMKDIFTGVKDIVVGIFAGMFTSIKFWAVDKVGDLAAWVQVAWAKVQSAYVKARNFIVSLFGGEEIPPPDVSALEASLDALDAKREEQLENARRQMKEQIATGVSLVKEGGMEIGELAVDIGTDVASGFKSAWEKVSGIFKDMFGKGGTVPSSTDEGTDEIVDDLNKVEDKAEETAEAVGAAGEGVVEETAKTTEEIAAEISEEIKDLGKMTDQELLALSLANYQREQELEQELIEKRKQQIEDLKNKWLDYFNTAQQVLNQISAVFDQYFKNQSIELENEYKERKDYIEQNVKDETQRTEMLEQLDEEFNEKRARLKQKQARIDKAVAIFQAVINTARAIVEALPNIPLAIIVGALGAAQIALIAAQPIPQFAEGADFIVPPGYENDTFPMLVSSGEHVEVTPERDVSPGARPNLYHVMINLDGDVLADFVTEASRDRQIIIDAGAVK